MQSMHAETHWVLAYSCVAVSSVPHSLPPVPLYAAGDMPMYAVDTCLDLYIHKASALTNIIFSGSVSLPISACGNNNE